MEVARKLRAPEDEVDTVDSYTKALGTKTAPIVVVVLLSIGTVMLISLVSLAYGGDMPAYWYALLIAPMLPATWAAVRFRGAPSADVAKMCEKTVGLAMILGYAGLLTAIGLARGIQWV